MVKGEEPYAYYVPGETHTTTGASAGASVNMGSITGALGIGGAVGTLANGVNVGGGSSSATTNITYSQRIVTVPPMSAKVLPKKPLVSYIRDQYYKTIVVKDFGGVIGVGNAGGTVNAPHLYLYSSNMQPMAEGERIEYTAENSPVSLHSFVAYSLVEDCRQTVTLSHNCFVRYAVAMKNGKAYIMKYEEELGQYVPDIKRYRDVFVCRGKNSRYWF